MKVPWIEKASKRKKLLVGVSGGVDSMALLHLLSESGFRKVVVCHLDHGLRGRASTGDANFVSRQAKRLGYEFEKRRTDLRKAIEATGESMETAGRNARHLFFADCSRKFRCDTILLAHHADDQAETVLWNLMRGSLGCRGMREFTHLKMDGKRLQVIRPLLGTRKSELMEWMRENGFKWREDTTNEVNDVVRNRVRNEVIPLLNGISKRDVVPAFARAAETDRDWRGLLDWAVVGAGATDPQGRLHLGAMGDFPAILKRAVIADYLRGKGVAGVDHDLLVRCVDLLDVGNAASVNLTGGKRLRRRAGRIFIDGD